MNWRPTGEVSLWCRPGRSLREPGGREGRYWPALDYATRLDQAGFRLADDPQLGVFRRAAEVTRDAGNALAGHHP